MSQSPPRRRALTVLLAALSMIGPFSIDMIFPGFPGMARDFAASPLAMQQTVSVYLVAYAVMSLVHGPLADARGRKPVIVVGMLGYALASVGAGFAGSLDALLAWRALQGTCAGAGIVVGRAVIRDLFDGAEAQRLMSQVMMIFGLAPALAPVIGAELVHFDGWRGLFWALTVFAAALVVGALVVLPESHPPERRTRLEPRAMLAGWGAIVGDRGFWPLAISGTSNFSAMFLYIASAPAIVIGVLGLSTDAFPWLFVPIIGGLVAGSALSSRLAGRHSAAPTVRLAYGLMALGTVVNLALASWFASQPPAWALAPLFLYGCGVGLAMPTLTLLLLDRFPAQRGAASSLQAFVSLLFNAILAGAVSTALSGSLMTMAIGAAVIALVGWLAWRWYARIAAREVARHACADANAVALEAPPVEPG